MVKCPKCGETSRIKKEDKFCHKCGCNLKTGSFDSATKLNVNENMEHTIIRLCKYIEELVVLPTSDTPQKIFKITEAINSLMEARDPFISFRKKEGK